MAIAFPPGSFADIADQAQQLGTEAKQELVALLKAWIIEERRDEIARNVELSLQEHAEGKTAGGTVDDLMKDMYAAD